MEELAVALLLAAAAAVVPQEHFLHILGPLEVEALVEVPEVLSEVRAVVDRHLVVLFL